jgi:DNA-binding CsgD family transcriptional regulator
MLNFFKKDSLKVKSFELILNEREFQVLRYLSDGLSNKEISDKIFLSIESVKKITQSIYTKLNVKNRSQAINAYLKK